MVEGLIQHLEVFML